MLGVPEHQTAGGGRSWRRCSAWTVWDWWWILTAGGRGHPGGEALGLAAGALSPPARCPRWTTRRRGSSRRTRPPDSLCPPPAALCWPILAAGPGGWSWPSHPRSPGRTPSWSRHQRKSLGHRNKCLPAGSCFWKGHLICLISSGSASFWHFNCSFHLPLIY